MSLGTWDPSADQTPSLDADNIARLLEATASEQEDFGLSTQEVSTLAPSVRDGAIWKAAVADLTDPELTALIRLITAGEMRFDAWKADANSPVIVLAAELRRRGSYPDELTAWIKSTSNNRFLPWGSLLDRL